MLARIPIATIISAACLVQSCSWLNTRHYNVDKLSPAGTYRLKVECTVTDEGDFAGHFTDQGKEEVFKGQETIYDNKWNYRDNWESTFIDDNPSIEWIGDNALRMGSIKSQQPFTNELLILNETAEVLKHIGVSFGKSESFEVFDLSPGARVVLQVSPGRDYNSSGDLDLSFGYGGETWSGKALQGAAQYKQPNHSVKMELRIKPEDIGDSRN